MRKAALFLTSKGKLFVTGASAVHFGNKNFENCHPIPSELDLIEHHTLPIDYVCNYIDASEETAIFSFFSRDEIEKSF
jgi:hypothetical protein